MTLKQRLKKLLKENSRKGASFTLIELVIVIGILAVLAVVVIIVLNPSEFLKQARDSTRMSDLQTINSAIGQYQADGGTSLGSSNTVYVSIPDSSISCANLGLPALPDGWAYKCSNSANYRKTDNSGWIPINFTLSYGQILNILPIDSINTTSTGNYYTYTPGGSWELNAILESSKYRNNTSIVKRNLPGVLAVGSNLSLSPIFDNSGMVGYWKFDEGSGTTANDSSGFGKNGTLYSSSTICSNPPTSGCPQWTSGKVAGALSFDGVDDYVAASPISVGNNFTLSVWINRTGTTNTYVPLIEQGGTRIFRLIRYNNRICFGNDSATDNFYCTQNIFSSTNFWYYVVAIFNGSGHIFVNGVEYSLTQATNIYGAWGTNQLNIGYRPYTTSVGSFNGPIDDVRIYNRALSAAEISAIYNATK